jgi:hypothetical protein
VGKAIDTKRMAAYRAAAIDVLDREPDFTASSGMMMVWENFISEHMAAVMAEAVQLRFKKDFWEGCNGVYVTGGPDLETAFGDGKNYIVSIAFDNQVGCGFVSEI